MTKRLLVQTQLSNYNSKGKFILECDSGWQMVMGRVREMLRLNHDLEVTVMGPIVFGDGGRQRQVVTEPWDINRELWEKYGADGENRLHYFEHDIIANALVTRYDFDWTALACDLDLGMQKLGQVPKWDAVYVNDPMHLRNLKALFHVVGGYQPRFCVHSHFIDNPEVPKFPKEASLWLGQCEAAIKADYNFWQCRSSMDIFLESMNKWFRSDLVQLVKQKSMPWDDGYSVGEITESVDESRLRFTEDDWYRATDGKVVIFFPNRISPSSGDYTNGMKFMFDVLPELRKRRQDFVVVCGNPNQKIGNAELLRRCGKDGYVMLTDDTFTREEYKYVASHADIALGLYNADAYGGTASRECIELGCLPVWLDNFEYATLAREALGDDAKYILARPDVSDLVDILDARVCSFTRPAHRAECKQLIGKLQRVTRERCSYEATTPKAMAQMDLLPSR